MENQKSSGKCGSLKSLNYVNFLKKLLASRLFKLHILTFVTDHNLLYEYFLPF